MNITKTKLPGVLIVEPKVFGDPRGFFVESYQKQRYQKIGIGPDFVQDNQSRSCKGVLRGLHFQVKHPQGKLVRVSRGAVYDVAVDINPDSSTCGQFVGVELTEDNQKQLWIPAGYAHGFCVMSDVADFQYKCTDYYAPGDEGGILWNDPEIAIPWPVASSPILSEKDEKYPTLAQYLEGLKK